MLKRKAFDLDAEDRNLPHRDGFGALKAYSIRIHEKQMRRVEDIFRSQGISTSAGLRQVIYSWLNDRGGR